MMPEATANGPNDIIFVAMVFDTMSVVKNIIAHAKNSRWPAGRLFNDSIFPDIEVFSSALY
jgi:hypothetical protein